MSESLNQSELVDVTQHPEIQKLLILEGITAQKNAQTLARTPLPEEVGSKVTTYVKKSKEDFFTMYTDYADEFYEVEDGVIIVESRSEIIEDSVISRNPQPLGVVNGKEIFNERLQGMDTWMENYGVAPGEVFAPHKKIATTRVLRINDSIMEMLCGDPNSETATISVDWSPDGQKVYKGGYIADAGYGLEQGEFDKTYEVISYSKQRTEEPNSGRYSRVEFPPSKIDWDENFPDYEPTNFDAVGELSSDERMGPMDDNDPSAIDFSERFSQTGEIQVDDRGRPLNPEGRTGTEGRGELWKWGPNHAADPVVTRFNPQTGRLEALLITRQDNGEVAIPGGMVDPGERASTTLKRELEEEAGVVVDFEGADVVYKGVVDDPRNTDNSWMETIVSHVHLDPEVAKKVEPEAGDDAATVDWYDLDQLLEDGQAYASHAEFLQAAADNAPDSPSEAAIDSIGKSVERALDTD